MFTTNNQIQTNLYQNHITAIDRERALENFEKCLNLKKGSATIDRVKDTAPGIHGWANWNSNTDISEDAL